MLELQQTASRPPHPHNAHNALTAICPTQLIQIAILTTETRYSARICRLVSSAPLAMQALIQMARLQFLPAFTPKLQYLQTVNIYLRQRNVLNAIRHIYQIR